ncbi:hypothetical protein CTAM01_01590 [Colletotrichum tamarilloi]|uniref:Uncharacterized protein n=1 Tax=Colletotrichum tamarilloi TaxID=1209934 RepID=A0ABQ9RS92_9PEZI|nr:uncharacterized protein CTAM01_01590 [Colletotrichum tamarilloi]KAK1511017.1 hypothetical protein CTAM01_01590 [Colletotrichum tamarilloi]
MPRIRKHTDALPFSLPLKCILETAPKNGGVPYLSSNISIQKVGNEVVSVYNSMLTPNLRPPSNEHCRGRSPFPAALRKCPAETLLEYQTGLKVRNQESRMPAECEGVVILRGFT